MPQAGLDRHRRSSAAALAELPAVLLENLPGRGKIQPQQAREGSVGCPALPFPIFQRKFIFRVLRSQDWNYLYFRNLMLNVWRRAEQRACGWQRSGPLLGSPLRTLRSPPQQLFPVPLREELEGILGRSWKEFYTNRGLEAINASGWEWLNISKQLGGKLVVVGGWERCCQVLCRGGIILFSSFVYTCLAY